MRWGSKPPRSYAPGRKGFCDRDDCHHRKSMHRMKKPSTTTDAGRTPGLGCELCECIKYRVGYTGETHNRYG